MHSPDNAEEVQEARRLGGLRRRREVTVQGACELEDLATVAGLRRILEVAALDALGLDNSIARARTLRYLVSVGLRALEIGELEHRVADLEAAVQSQRPTQPSAFDAESPFEFAEAAS